MKDGDFDRLRIPMGNGSGGEPGAELDAEPDEVDDAVEEARRLRVAATSAQLAAGSAIIAGLILLGVAALRRRGGRSKTDGAA